MSSRKEFIQQVSGAAMGVALLPSLKNDWFTPKKKFEISLAQWSLHRALFSKKMDTLDFPAKAKNDFGISVVEYVNQFFMDKAKDTGYLSQLLQRCKDNGVKNHLIMCDGEGQLANTNDVERKKAVENHYKWVDAAKYLGCITIRVNAAGTGSKEDVGKAAVDGLSMLAEYAGKENINVIVENHGGYSSDGEWLSGVMKKANNKRIGTLPDFGNFCITRGKEGCQDSYDRYKGTKELMPYAKGVSAKTYDFDANGNCVETDYKKIMKIVNDANFSGYVGIEYEGEKIAEDEGIRMTKKLIEKYA